LSKTGEFTIDFSSDVGDVISEGRLHFEGCDMKLEFFKSPSGGSIFEANDDPFSLPAVATIKQGSVVIKDKRGGTPLSSSCSPSFTKGDEGQKINVAYSMSSSDLRMFFNGVSLYYNSEKKRGLSTPMKILIGVLALIILLCGLGFAGYLLLCWFSKRQEHAKRSKDKGETATKKQSKEEASREEAANKPKTKKSEPIVKQVDETQSVEEIPVVKQNVMPKQSTNTPIIKPGLMPKNSPIPDRKPKVRFSPEVNVEFISADMPRTAKQDVKAIHRRLANRSISPAKNTIEEWQARQKAKSD